MILAELPTYAVPIGCSCMASGTAVVILSDLECTDRRNHRDDDKRCAYDGT